MTPGPRTASRCALRGPLSTVFTRTNGVAHQIKLNTPKPPPGWQHGHPASSMSKSAMSPTSIASSSAISASLRFMAAAMSASAIGGSPPPPAPAGGWCRPLGAGAGRPPPACCTGAADGWTGAPAAPAPCTCACGVGAGALLLACGAPTPALGGWPRSCVYSRSAAKPAPEPAPPLPASLSPALTTVLLLRAAMSPPAPW
mmetsp:Transcript_16016/g.40733  ORF Transcript_16016/g.40733 Transcript_16016/m.40733 type:complete len:200 (+) Transcript_16016:100-699(+)